MRDPYSVLGVSKNASPPEIKSAFRKLAKKYHPDSNRNEPGAEAKFSEINRAYEIVGDADKRARYDRGEIDADGKQKFAGFEGFGRKGDFRQDAGPFDFEFRTGGFGGAEDILKEAFGSAFGGRSGRGGFRPRTGRAGPGPGNFDDGGPGGRDLDLHAVAIVGIDELARGKGRVKLANGKTLSFSIPPGAKDGQTIRLGGQGQHAGPRTGDALITLRFRSDPRYSVEGPDLRITETVPLEVAVNGGKLTIATFDGKVSLTIPPWTDSGRTFRLKGKGLPKKDGGNGDILLTTAIALPERYREALQALFGERGTNGPA